MENIKNALKLLGLGEQEVDVYVKLLYLKESTASNLGKEMKTHRRGVYDVVERLVKKGFLTFIEKDNKKYYKPLDPKQIMGRLSERESEIKQSKKNISALVSKISNLQSHGAEAQVMFGKEGIKNLYLDELSEEKTIFVICTIIDRTEDMLGNFLKSYTRDRISKGINTKIIAAEENRNNLKNYGLLEARYLPSENISPSSTAVYGNKVAIILWSDEPVVILVKSSEIAEDFKKHFEMIWKIAKK